jgi:nicotinate-nucleotide pyrophosphorylase (carboxylating)
MFTSDDLIRRALTEDIGPGDITTEAIVPEGALCSARLVAREAGVLSGMDIFRHVFGLLHGGIDRWEGLKDGESFAEGQEIASFHGRARPILTGERVALNFLQHLSGVATATAAYVEEVKGLNTLICETRKTTPLLRESEKRAVIHGGGRNHRQALYHAILIKENHIEAAGDITQAIARAKFVRSHMTAIEVEVTTLEELDEALVAKPEAILLDNMDLPMMAEAVKRADGSEIILEASGTMTLDRVRAVAETGVDVISVGALTHSVKAIDFSLRITHD